MNKLLIIGAVMFLSACAGAPENTTASNATYGDKYDEDGIVCRLTTVVGSNMKRKVCTTAEEREAMREAAREGWLRTQQSSETGGGDS